MPSLLRCEYRAQSIENYRVLIESPSNVFVLSRDRDLANSQSACAPLPNVGEGEGETSTVVKLMQLIILPCLNEQVERDTTLSILFLCSLV
jgi:hypothetical protein